MTADGYAATGINVTTLLMEAYGVTPDYLVVGAAQWTDETMFDIEARVAGQDIAALKQLGPDQRIAMVQQVLTDSFRLKVHREDRIQPTAFVRGVFHQNGRDACEPPSSRTPTPGWSKTTASPKSG